MSISAIAQSRLPQRDMWRTEILAPAERGRLLGQWRNLFDAAASPNPFYGPDYIDALAANVLPETGWKIIAVWRQASGARERLVALMPVQKPGAAFMPVRALRHPYIVGGAPLLDAEDPEAAGMVMFDAAARHLGASMLILDDLRLDDTVVSALQAACLATNRSAKVFFEAARAAINVRDAQAVEMAGKSRSLRRRNTRLRKAGCVEFVHYLKGDAEFGMALKEFLGLEAAGWKRRAGTAMISHEDTMAFARAAFSRNSTHPSVRLDALRLDGRMIAASLHLLAPGYAASIKSAYDEAYGEFSPGLVLDCDIAAELIAAPWVGEMDSVALPGHPLEKIWPSRVRFGSMAIGVDAAMSKSEFALRFNLEILQRSGRELAKQAYRFVRPEKR